MDNVLLFRFEDDGKQTLGMILAKGRTFYTLERPWLNNQSDISCIPDGDYIVKYLARSASGRYSNVYWIQSVDGRFGVLIHAGNVVRHTKGCILIGKTHGYLAGQKAVLSSAVGLAQFRSLMGKEDFMLKIRSAA